MLGVNENRGTLEHVAIVRPHENVTPVGPLKDFRRIDHLFDQTQHPVNLVDIGALPRVYYWAETLYLEQQGNPANYLKLDVSTGDPFIAIGKGAATFTVSTGSLGISAADGSGVYLNSDGWIQLQGSGGKQFYLAAEDIPDDPEKVYALTTKAGFGVYYTEVKDCEEEET